jgi:hypothetical protein
MEQQIDYILIVDTHVRNTPQLLTIDIRIQKKAIPVFIVPNIDVTNFNTNIVDGTLASSTIVEQEETHVR